MFTFSARHRSHWLQIGAERTKTVKQTGFPTDGFERFQKATYGLVDSALLFATTGAGLWFETPRTDKSARPALYLPAVMLNSDNTASSLWKLIPGRFSLVAMSS